MTDRTWPFWGGGLCGCCLVITKLVFDLVKCLVFDLVSQISKGWCNIGIIMPKLYQLVLLLTNNFVL